MVFKMNKDDSIFVAGHSGLIGSALVRCLRQAGYSKLLLRTRAELDLTDLASVNSFFQENKPNYVFLAAGRVGGILDNKNNPVDFINTNLAIQLNVLKTANHFDVKRLILFGSSCMYPRECAQPMAEELLLTGYPEPTSLTYAISKLAGMQMCLAYNQQYGENRFIPVIPNSVYGPNDNFDPQSGHVLSSLIHRFHFAVQNNVKTLTLWGSGKPRREFIYVDDIAKACIQILSRDIESLYFPLNIGTGIDFSISELADKIADVVGYCGVIDWDTSKPDGAAQKLLDSSRILSFGWRPETSLEEGLKKTYQWYLKSLFSSKRYL